MKLASFLILSVFYTQSLLGQESTFDKNALKNRIAYLAQSQSCEDTIALYKTYKEELGRHDFEVLQRMAITWIDKSARSTTPTKQTLGIFGFGVAGLNAPTDVLELAIASDDPIVQSAAIGFLGKMQEDYADILLNKAMSSPFLYSRLEAAFLLSQRKASTATGQIESLMYRLPPPMRYFFPEFFAIIGTSESIHVLRHLMDDSFSPTKVAAILSAAMHGRDDLLPPIRAGATHLDHAEQEACAAALGYLRDMKSIKKLKKLSTSSSSSVQLAALYSLHVLGDKDAASKIALLAKSGNLFACGLLKDIPGYEEALIPLTTSSDMQLRFNAALTLLKKKDPRSLPILLEFLLKDTRDLGFQPQSSQGASLHYWKIVPSLKQHAQESFFDIQAMSLALREQIILEALELPENQFLKLAASIFESKQNELIPILVTKLENLRSPEAITLLKKQSQKTGAPLIRTYANLALFRLKEDGPYQEVIRSFLQKSKALELIRFRPSLPWNVRLVDSYTLTPEESSALLISAYEALIEQQDPKGIDILLEAISEGNEQNRPVLAGILIHALQ